MLTKAVTILLAAAVAVQAAPYGAKRQAVTELISSGTVPPGCRTVSTSMFGIGIHKVTDVPQTPVQHEASQGGDGQPGVPTATNIVTVISDGQPQGPTSTMSMMPISQIHDGQAQAYYSPVSQIGDGQVQAPTGTAVSQITDGQVQAPTGNPVSQITDGQVQAPTGNPVSQITDGQVQAPTGNPVSQITDGQVQAPTGNPVSQITDGQVQAPTGSPVSQITDGQVQAPTVTGPAATQKTDGQPNAPTGVTQGTDGQPAATPAPPSVHMVACKTDSTLELTIENGVLYDGLRRQGYIASNYQFQFDAGAPQAGAIITAGFSLCSNGTLALGGSAIFYQCLSGTFYNLYDRHWAPQCEPVYLTALELVNCPA